MAFRIPGENGANSRFLKRIERSQLSQDEQEKAIHFKLFEHRTAEILQNLDERSEYDLAVADLSFLMILESIRDANAPKNPNDSWNENFCTALDMLSEVKPNAKDAWAECIRKEEQSDRHKESHERT